MKTTHRPWLTELLEQARANPGPPPQPPVVLEFEWEQWCAMPKSLQEWLRVRSLRDRIDHYRNGKSIIHLLLSAGDAAEFWQRAG